MPDPHGIPKYSEFQIWFARFVWFMIGLILGMAFG